MRVEMERGIPSMLLYQLPVCTGCSALPSLSCTHLHAYFPLWSNLQGPCPGFILAGIAIGDEHIQAGSSRKNSNTEP